MAEKTILLVDDEQVFVEPLVEALIHEGYRVLTATSGDQGLAVARSEKIDLAVVDVMMPPGPGLELLTSRLKTGLYVVEELRRDYPALPIFCLSVISDEQTIRAIQRNGVRFFRKGETSLKHVLETIDATLRAAPGSARTIRRWSG